MGNHNQPWKRGFHYSWAVFLQSLDIFLVPWEIILLYFLGWNFTCYWHTSKCKFSDLPLIALKFTKFLMSFLETRVSFSSNFASLFRVIWDMTFSSEYLHPLDKRIQSKCQFLDFHLLAKKLTKLLMSFFNPQVSFLWNFATPFSVMTHNSSESF